ncbi:DUF2062 domain-containing protein [Candidatus Babeliales bacterium]|nr:DUF2062 domain-containing protein [Candidatus Babeliales bacterium]
MAQINLEKIKKKFKSALTSGWTIQKLTLSFCIGIYIAFSPVPGGHTIMMLFAKWLFNLNLPVTFMASSLNNPWTIIPFFSLDYAFGYWFLHKLMGLNPTWVISLAKIFGSGKICLWSFFIGGNILGIFFALICYPIIYIFFKKFLKKFPKTNKSCVL